MKTCTISCILLTIAGIASTSRVWAQHRSNVGVNITLLPIQTISIEPPEKDVDKMEKGRSYAMEGVDFQQIKSFSTAGYQLTIDREEASQPTYPAFLLPAQREPVAPRGPADAMPSGGQEHALPEPKPLVFYSIRVN